MEENVNEVVGMEENPTPETNEVQKVDNSAEDTLIVIGNIVFIFGIIATIICAFTMVVIKDPSYTYITEYMFNPSGFATTIIVFFSSLISGGVLKVLANISITLKDINSKTK